LRDSASYCTFKNAGEVESNVVLTSLSSSSLSSAACPTPTTTVSGHASFVHTFAIQAQDTLLGRFQFHTYVVQEHPPDPIQRFGKSVAELGVFQCEFSCSKICHV